MDPCKPAVAPTMKATQGSYHNHCSFCLFNLKNEGFCITEDTTIPPVVSDKLWNNDLMIILLLDLVCIWMKWFITVDLFSLLPLYLMNGHYRATVTQILLNYFADVQPIYKTNFSWNLLKEYLMSQTQSMSNKIQFKSLKSFYFRIDGMMMNSPMFAETFHCRPGSRMNPARKCGHMFGK